MTALCSGGASGPKPGVNEVIIFSGSALATLLGNSGTPWGIAAAGALGVATYEATGLCTSDPPAEPTITGADWLALFTLGDLAAHIIAIEKFNALVTRAAWFSLCQCTSVATPSQPVVPPPADMPTLPAIGPSPCFSKSIQHTAIYDPTSADVTGIQNALGPVGAQVNQVRGSVTEHATKLPSPLPTTAEFTFATPASPSLAEGSTISVYFYTAANAQIGTFEVGPGYLASHTYKSTIAIPATADHWFISHSNTAVSPPTANDTIALTMVCSGGSPTSLSTPCITDPATMAVLEQILSYVTLTQRQLAPFAYVASTSHAGLTGDGSFDIQGLLGVKIALTTVPASLGVAAGTPEEHFDLGFVTFGSADGYPHSIRIEHNPQLALPARCSAFTKFAYTLHPGVVATITELVREP